MGASHIESILFIEISHHMGASHIESILFIEGIPLYTV
jgi:hypothetical protein